MNMLCDVLPPHVEMSYINTDCNDETLIRFVRCFPMIKDLCMPRGVSDAGIYV